MYFNYYSCLNTVFTLFVLHSSPTLSSVLNQPEHKLETEIRLILDRHNQYRTCHHAPPLTIDPQLTQDAQSLANALASEQINLDLARRWRHGNLFITQWNLQLDDLFAINENSKFSFNPVDKWYNEVKFYFEDRSRTDHFTRIVWKDTKKLGVGIAQNDKGFVYIVCKYDPEGNIPGLYDKNVIIPDEKMVHATDICILPPLTSPSKKKGKTTKAGFGTSTVTVQTSSISEPGSVASASDFKASSTYSQEPSSTITQDLPIGGTAYSNLPDRGSSTVPTSTATQTDILASLYSTSTYPPASIQTDFSASFDSNSATSTQTVYASTTEPSYTIASETSSEKSTHLGSITWSRIMPSTSTVMPSALTGSPSTFGIPTFTSPTMTSTSAQPVSLQDLLIPSTPSAASPPVAADSTLSSFGGGYEPSTPGSLDILPTVSSLPETRPEDFVSTSTFEPHIGLPFTAEPPSPSPSTSIPPEFKGRICNSSDPSGNLSCILPPVDRPQGADHEAQAITPSSNPTTDWLDLPEHGNQTEDAFGPFGKPESKSEYLKFTLLLMGLLVASMSAAVSLLAVFAIFKLFVCCRRARNGNSQDASSSPAAQSPSNLVSVIPTTNPRPISPTLSRPASPVFQRTVLAAKLY